MQELRQYLASSFGYGLQRGIPIAPCAFAQFLNEAARAVLIGHPILHDQLPTLEGAKEQLKRMIAGGTEALSCLTIPGEPGCCAHS